MEDDTGQMFEEIQDSLEDLGYNDKVSELNKSVTDGFSNPELTGLVSQLVTELQQLAGTEEGLNPLKPGGDIQEWKMELSSFLRELGCPYKDLTEGDVSARFTTRKSRLMLLDFLISELMSEKINLANKPRDTMNINMEESATAGALKAMLLALGFPKPPDNITSLQLFEKVNGKVREMHSKAPEKLIGKPIFDGKLSQNQWEMLEEIQAELNDEYSLRRKMLLTRLDATVQSFTWSDRIKAREGEVAGMYGRLREVLTVKPCVGIPDLLAAREDAAIVEKVSSVKTRAHTKTSLNKVLIGAVPDRGGRTDTMHAPPPEMPSWAQRQPDQGRGGRGGGRGQHGRALFTMCFL